MHAHLHTDVVGSMLRPPALLAAREALAVGAMTPAAFKRVEDAAVDDAIAAQEAAGLEVVTDGEMRRTSFQSQLTEAVDGFQNAGLDAFLWGDWHGDAAVGDANRPRPEDLRRQPGGSRCAAASRRRSSPISAPARRASPR